MKELDSAIRRRTALAIVGAAVLGAAVPAHGARRNPDPYVILDAAEVRNPFDWIEPIATLWKRGDRLQAAFWYYVFQIRSRPWANADRGRTGGSGAAALRGSIGETLGRPINEWLGSDPAAWKETGRAAIAFEKRLRFHAGRPDGIDETAWAAMNQSAREEYEKGFGELWDQYSFAQLEDIRRSNRLYVGPLRNPGQPLRW
jgi:hypothetical protein